MDTCFFRALVVVRFPLRDRHLQHCCVLPYLRFPLDLVATGTREDSAAGQLALQCNSVRTPKRKRHGTHHSDLDLGLVCYLRGAR